MFIYFLGNTVENGEKGIIGEVLTSDSYTVSVSYLPFNHVPNEISESQSGCLVGVNLLVVVGRAKSPV